jgi:hypothetical protein
MGFVLDTALVPAHPVPSVSDFSLEGTVGYHGAITVPIATNPAFQWEVQIGHGDGSGSVVQYYLPRGLRLPVEEGHPYVLLFRRRSGFEGESVGLVVSRPTSGLPPLLFVGDAGPFERAFEPEDLLMSPLKVFVEPGSDCPPLVDPDCGGDRVLDQLRFDSSTGGAITAVSVPQGGADELPVFGDPFRVLTLASSHADPPCLDFNPVDVAYLAVSIAALPLACDPSRFHMWSSPTPFEVGTFCDEITFCAGSPTVAAQAQAVAPSLQCGAGYGPCDPGEVGCAWNPDLPIDQALYDEACAVSVLPSPPDGIQCQVYF